MKPAWLTAWSSRHSVCGDRSGLLGLIGGSAQETARRRGRTIKRSGPVMFGSCLQVCDGCSRPRPGLRPGSLLPHAPIRPGGGRLAAAGPPPWSRLSRHGDHLACAGRTYALPSARWELLLTCRQGNNALPVSTVTVRHGTGDRRGPRQGRSRPHGSRAPHRPARRDRIAQASSWFAGALRAGRPGGTDPLGRLRAVSALFEGTSLARSMDTRRGRLAGGAAGLCSALWIRCGVIRRAA